MLKNIYLLKGQLYFLFWALLQSRTIPAIHVASKLCLKWNFSVLALGTGACNSFRVMLQLTRNAWKRFLFWKDIHLITEIFHCSFDLFLFSLHHIIIYDTLIKWKFIFQTRVTYQAFITGWYTTFFFFLFKFPIFLKFKFSHCYLIASFRTRLWVIGNYDRKFFLWNSKNKVMPVE